MKSEEEVRAAFVLMRDYIRLINDVPLLRLAFGDKSFGALVGMYACLGWLLGESLTDPCAVVETLEIARRDLGSADALRKQYASVLEELIKERPAQAPPTSPNKTIH